MSYNLRGFVTEIDEQNRFAPDGTLASMVVRGKNPQGDVAETYDVKDGTYTYKSPVDTGTGKAASNLAYVAFGGTFDSFIFLLDAMLRSPEAAITPGRRSKAIRSGSVFVPNCRRRSSAILR